MTPKLPLPNTLSTGSIHNTSPDGDKHRTTLSPPQHQGPVVRPHNQPLQPEAQSAQASANDIEQMLHDLEISFTASAAPKETTQDATKTQEPSDHVSTERADSSPSAKTIEVPATGKTACINPPMAFSTTWYSHPEVPDIWICSRCFERHFEGTKFEEDFVGCFFEDGQARWCSFDSPRIKDHL